MDVYKQEKNGNICRDKCNACRTKIPWTRVRITKFEYTCLFSPNLKKALSYWTSQGKILHGYIEAEKHIKNKKKNTQQLH